MTSIPLLFGVHLASWLPLPFHRPGLHFLQLLGVTVSQLAVFARFFFPGTPQFLLPGVFLSLHSASAFPLALAGVACHPALHRPLEMLPWLPERCPSVTLVTSMLAVCTVYRLLGHIHRVLPHGPGLCPGSC